MKVKGRCIFKKLSEIDGLMQSEGGGKVESLPFTKAYWRIIFRITFEKAKEVGTQANFEEIVFINVVDVVVNTLVGNQWIKSY